MERKYPGLLDRHTCQVHNLGISTALALADTGRQDMPCTSSPQCRSEIFPPRKEGTAAALCWLHRCPRHSQNTAATLSNSSICPARKAHTLQVQIDSSSCRTHTGCTNLDRQWHSSVLGRTASTQWDQPRSPLANCTETQRTGRAPHWHKGRYHSSSSSQATGIPTSTSQRTMRNRCSERGTRYHTGSQLWHFLHKAVTETRC